MYFVTTIRVKENRDTRCIGYYEVLSNARYTVKNCELDEAGWYQYAVIEQFGQGWYPPAKLEEWYRIDKKRVNKISKPKRFKRTCNFGIG